MTYRPGWWGEAGNIEKFLWALRLDGPHRPTELLLMDDYEADPTGNKGCRILQIKPEGETDGQVPEH